MSRPRRLLFLDFDGVLHPTSAPGANPDLCFSRVADLAEAFGEADAADASAGARDCQIVITSSWRHDYEMPALLAHFPPALRQRIIGATGLPVIGRWARYEEIRAFLRDAAPLAQWRALDDSFNEFPPGCPELIRCDPNTGLAAAQVRMLKRWLASSI